MRQQTASMLYSILAREWQQELCKWQRLEPFSRDWERQRGKVAHAYTDMLEAYKLIDPRVLTPSTRTGTGEAHARQSTEVTI